MKVHMSFELSDELRRMIRERRGMKGLVTRNEVKDALNSSFKAYCLGFELGTVAQSAVDTAIDPATDPMLAGLGDCQSPPAHLLRHTDQPCGMDHLFPLGPKTASTKCVCGLKTWGSDSLPPEKEVPEAPLDLSIDVDNPQEAK